MLPLLLAVRLRHTAAAEARQEQGMVNLAFDRDGSRTSNIDLTGTVPAIRPFAGVSVRF